MALPNCNSSSHRKEGLNECAKGQPQPCFAAQLIAEAPNEGAKNKREYRAERLTVRDMERAVVLSVEQAGKGKGQLSRMLVGKIFCNCGGTRTCTLFPVWKAHQTNIAENVTESLMKKKK